MSNTIVLCGCEKSGKLDPHLVSQLMDSFAGRGLSCTYVNDLCGTAVLNPVSVRDCITDGAAILACQPRAVRWLLEFAGVSTESAGLSYVNLLDTTSGETISSLIGGDASAAEIEYDQAWTPWFPVIDYDRCNGCGKCLNFCLFGVYSFDDTRAVRVSAPANCKNKCPACARVCPQQAIMFPKSDQAPIDGTEPAGKFEASEELQQMMTGDVYAALAARRDKTKLSLLRTQQLEQAAAERAFCVRSPDGSCNCNCSDNDAEDSNNPCPSPGGDQQADSSECDCRCDNG